MVEEAAKVAEETATVADLVAPVTVVPVAAVPVVEAQVEEAVPVAVVSVAAVPVVDEETVTDGITDVPVTVNGQ